MRRLGIGLTVAMSAFLASVSLAAAGGPIPGQPSVPMESLPTGTGVAVTSDSSGVTILISLTSTRPGTPGTAPSTDELTQSAEPTCGATPINLGNSSPAWLREGVLLNPGTTPWVWRQAD